MKKLQNVLKDSELRTEQMISQMNEMKIDTERMQAEFEAK